VNERDFDELSAGYALNALSADDRRAFERALAQHPEHAAQAANDTDTVAALSDAIEDVVPPPALRDALLAQIAVTAQKADDIDEHFHADEDYAAAAPTPTIPGVAPRAAERDATPPAARGGFRQRWFVLAASVLLVAALGVGGAVVVQQLNRPAAVVALEQIENAPDAQSVTVSLADGGEATAHWSAQTGQAVLISDGLPALTDDQTFELWFVRDGSPIPAGTFDAADGDATALLSGEMAAGDIIAVTVEPAGGSPDGVPSTTPIVAIETA
jgi:anti-sigma-K factor RskA